MFIPLPIFMFFIAFIGLKNFKREYARLFERVATLMKIEEKIGFHDKRINRRQNSVLHCDEYYLSKSFIDIGKKYDNTKEFVDELIKNPPEVRYGNTYKIFRILFIVYMGLSIFLVIIMILLNIFAIY